MKNLIASLVAVNFFFLGVFAQGTEKAAAPEIGAKPVIAFEKSTHDFGKIAKGIPVTYEFQFTNTGSEPLIVNNVQKTCGCTVTDWTKTPILPGQKGTVQAQYNAAKGGKFKKPIHVISNASEERVTLYFEGEVLDDKADESGVPKKQDNILMK